MRQMSIGLGFLAALAVMGQPPAVPRTPGQAMPGMQKRVQELSVQEWEPEPQMELMKAGPPPCAGKPDLRTVGLSLSSPLVVGENVNSVTVRVQNFGTAPATNFFVKSELCPATGPCSGGRFPYPLGTGSLNGTLAPGAQAVVPLNGLVPYLQIPAGKYKIRILADATNLVKECNEANNTRTTVPLPFGAHCSQVDLISTGVGAVPVVPAATSGQGVKVSLTVFNQGNAYPGNPPAKAQVLLVNNSNLGQQFAVWNGALNPLTTGQMQHFIQFPVTIPSGMPSGMYRWRTVLDSTNAIVECNEGNNILDQPQLIKIN